MASVEFVGVGKAYSTGHQALSEFSLQVRDAELVVLVGPSGCGKSTLLRLLAGLEQVDAGVIRIGGRVVNTLSPQQRNIAMVFQDYALYPTMTVRGNLEFPLKMRRLDRAERQRRIARVVELLDLGDQLERLPRQLSGGQKQRVAMGRALVREPSVFLLDEPLSNLDAKLRVQVRTEIVELQRRTGTTMIYVTHDQVEAMTMSDRIAVMHCGRLQQVGTPRELYEEPANTFVAGFIGMPPVNLIPVAIACRLSGEFPESTTGSSSREVGSGGGVPFGAATAAVRPEDLYFVDEPLGVPADVINVEYLGHEVLVHVRLQRMPAGGEVLLPSVLRAEQSSDLQMGERVRIAARPRTIRWFDDRGVSLTSGSGSPRAAAVGSAPCDTAREG
jgi:ABC-type sugar transport system ATPase subunit